MVGVGGAVAAVAGCGVAGTAGWGVQLVGGEGCYSPGHVHTCTCVICIHTLHRYIITYIIYIHVQV